MNIATLRQYWNTILIVAEMTYREMARDVFVIFTIVLQPLIVAFIGLWMLKDKGSDYGIFVMIGSGLTGLWSSALFLGGNSITRDRWSGTLETMVAMPTPINVIAFGRNIASTLQSLLSMVASYILASVVLGYPLTVNEPVLFVISLGFTIIAFVSFGLLIAPLFLLNPMIQRFQNGMEFPVFILSGFLFPIALLPDYTTPLSYALAPYWAAKALHETTSGHADLQTVAGYWLMLLIFSLIYISISGSVFRMTLRKARQDATLNLQ